VFVPFKVSPYSGQAEKFEMIDEERTDQENGPACPKHYIYDRSRTAAAYVPNDLWRRTPLPRQQHHDQAGGEDKRGTLNQVGNDLGPAPFEPLPRHDAVLNGECPKQQGINQNAGECRSRKTGINGLGDVDISHKTNGI
jgi:hypothetical protein